MRLQIALSWTRSSCIYWHHLGIKTDAVTLPSYLQSRGDIMNTRSKHPRFVPLCSNYRWKRLLNSSVGSGETSSAEALPWHGRSWHGKAKPAPKAFSGAEMGNVPQSRWPLPRRKLLQEGPATCSGACKCPVVTLWACKYPVVSKTAAYSQWPEPCL